MPMSISPPARQKMKKKPSVCIINDTMPMAQLIGPLTAVGLHLPLDAFLHVG